MQVIDETEDPLESVKLETMQASDIEVMDELLEVETEDTRESDAKDLLHISDDELTEGTNGNLVEGLQDMNIDEGRLIDCLDILGAGATMEVLTTQGMDVKDLGVEDELKQVSTDNSDENDVAYAEPVLEEEVTEPCSTPVELTPTMEVSDVEVEDTEGQDLDNEISQVIDENAGDSYIKDDKLSLFQLKAELVQDVAVNHNMLEQCAEIDALGSSILVSPVQPLLSLRTGFNYILPNYFLVFSGTNWLIYLIMISSSNKVPVAHSWKQKNLRSK